jgi:hypothetical protein
MISFRIGSEDAKKMELEFEPVFTTQQLINLNQTQIALKLSIDGKATDPFLANTLPPIFEKMGGRSEIVHAMSRERYSMPKAVIKDKINRWLSEEFEDEEMEMQNPKPAAAPKPKAPTEASLNPSSGGTPPTPGSKSSKKKKKKFNPFLLDTKDGREDPADSATISVQSKSDIELPRQNQTDSAELPIHTDGVNLHLQKLQDLKEKNLNKTRQNVRQGVVLSQTDGNKIAQEEGAFELPV